MAANKCVMAYRVRNGDLPEATRAMNSRHEWFGARVEAIIVGELASIVIVELNGRYPFVENEWEKYFG